jgi:hypothetical protein
VATVLTTRDQAQRVEASRESADRAGMPPAVPAVRIATRFALVGGFLIRNTALRVGGHSWVPATRVVIRDGP